MFDSQMLAKQRHEDRSFETSSRRDWLDNSVEHVSVAIQECYGNSVVVYIIAIITNNGHLDMSITHCSS